MGLGSIARTVIPPSMRARLRRSPTVRWMLGKVYAGVASVKHPLSPYTFYFDRARHPGMAACGVDECEDMAFAKKLIESIGAKTAWDVGANIGAWSLFLAGTKPIERVFCFEPDPGNQRILNMNRLRNGIPDMINIRDVALSDHPGEATFYGDPLTGCTGSLEQSSDFIEKHYGAKRTEYQVTLSTIDTEIAAGLPPPDFMKMDVEGHELSALKGATRLLTEHRPAIQLEVSQNHEEVSTLFHAAGYIMFGVTTGKRIERAAFATAAVHQSMVAKSGLSA
jgi:FkbM family methyltransferase